MPVQVSDQDNYYLSDLDFDPKVPYPYAEALSEPTVTDVGPTVQGNTSLKLISAPANLCGRLTSGGVVHSYIS